MSRSVETVSDSEKVFFTCWDYDTYDWGDMILNIQASIGAKYPSMTERDGKFIEYPYRETCIIVENDHCSISISEYCGIGVVCIFVNRSCEYPEIAEHWIAQCLAGILKIVNENVDPLRHVATFSNGGAIFERVDK